MPDEQPVMRIVRCDDTRIDFPERCENLVRFGLLREGWIWAAIAIATKGV